MPVLQDEAGDRPALPGVAHAGLPSEGPPGHNGEPASGSNRALVAAVPAKGMTSMAKRKPAKSQNPPTTEPLRGPGEAGGASTPPSPSLAISISNKTQEKIATLRKYHDIGLRALGKAPDGTDSQPEAIADLAAEAGVGAGTIRMAVTFARAYPGDELDRLLALRDPGGEPLGWYLVRVLLQVKEKDRRADFERRAAEFGWSRQDLWDAINAGVSVTRRAPKGGRKFAQSRSTEQALRRLVERCESLLRYIENVSRESSLASQVRTASAAPNPTVGLKELVRQARTRLREVEEAAREVADQFQRMEPRLKAAGRPKPAKSGVAEGTKPGRSDRSGPKGQ